MPQNYCNIRQFYHKTTAIFANFTAKLPQDSLIFTVAVPQNFAEFTALNSVP